MNPPRDDALHRSAATSRNTTKSDANIRQWLAKADPRKSANRAARHEDAIRKTWQRALGTDRRRQARLPSAIISADASFLWGSVSCPTTTNCLETVLVLRQVCFLPSWTLSAVQWFAFAVYGCFWLSDGCLPMYKVRFGCLHIAGKAVFPISSRHGQRKVKRQGWPVVSWLWANRRPRPAGGQNSRTIASEGALPSRRRQ